MLKIENLSYVVNDNGVEKVILDNINLCFNDNETIVITGHNGSGKSTLVKIIMGIHKPTSGRIYFNDTDITNLSITERAKLGLSFAFQQPVRFKGLKVRDLLETALNEKLKVGTSCDYLSKVGLCARDYLDRELDSKLSGGELKRIELALAFARKVELCIFDEPEAGIDMWSFNSLIRAFENERRAKKSIFVIVSHQERILNIADKIVIMDKGEIQEFDEKDKVLPKLKNAKICSKLEVNNE